MSRARAVKRKFSNCQHTSSDGPSGTKFNFPTMTTTTHPSLVIAAARHPFCRKARARAHIHTHTRACKYVSNTRVSGDIRRRNSLCPRKFASVCVCGGWDAIAEGGGFFFTQFHRCEAIPTPAYILITYGYMCYSRTYTRIRQAARLKFRLLDPR